ncbi:MAG: PKD domain-containing protein [Blastocatellales bacterium]|nr:PKD domain-containing protein [Blastocatellales bacterium]
MTFARRLLGLLLALTILGALVQAQTPRYTDDPRNQSPTVSGGTGLFTVYDAQTLRKGEFNFGFFANHYHRDPADVTFQVYPVNFQLGLGDRFEIFANFEAHKNINVGIPQLLSGFYMPDVRTPGLLTVGRLVIVPGQNGISVLAGDPCGNGGFPGPCLVPGSLNVRGPFVARPSGNDTAVYVGFGAPVGGILPALLPNVNPNYLPQAPFISRFNDGHMGDVWLGGKIRFTGPNNPFGFALIPLVKIPTTRQLQTGLHRGRGTGNFEYGLIAAFDGRLHRHINLSTNIGYIKRLDPRAEDMNLGPLCAGCGVVQGFGRSGRALDIPDELRSGIGFDFPLTQYMQLIAEVRSTHYVGSRTPTLLKNSPVDLIAGAKIYPARWFSISAAYQRHLNWFSELNNRHSANGFIFGLSVGRANERIDPVLPNQPPVVSLEVGAVTPVATNVVRASAQTVCAGDRVALRANASDPDGDTLLYSWTTTGGRIVGEGANTEFDTTGLAPGEYTITVQVDDGCGCVNFDTKTIRVENCVPPIICFESNLTVSQDKSQVRSGEIVNFSTPGVSGGQNYGNVSYAWTASVGTIVGSGTTARLDTTGVSEGATIQVRVVATSTAGNCSASGAASVTTLVAPPPPPKPVYRELTPCTTFKRNAARVDNACKAVLQDIARQMQADPQAILIVDTYRGPRERPANLDVQRGKNIRDRLADNSVGIQIDPNRIIVRPSGVSNDGTQTRLYFVPAGADQPAGAPAATLGNVTPERRAAPRRRTRR